MAVTLPLVLLAIDYFQKRKFDRNAILEKIPFFIFSVIFGIIAIRIQSNGAMGHFSDFNIFQRFLIAFYGLGMYFYKLVWPFDLCSFYPYPFVFIKEIIKFPLIFYIIPFLLAIIGFLAYYSSKLNRVIVFGLLFYLFSVSIVLQFVSVGIVIIADRYTYIPYIGLFFIIAWLYHFLEKKGKDTNSQNRTLFRNLSFAYAILLFVFGILCIYATYERTMIWKNSLTLWTDVIEKYPGKVENAYLNRGNYYARELSNKNNTYLDSAMADYQILLKMNKGNHNVYSTMGNVYAMKGQLEKSIQSYNNSIRLDSNDYKVYVNRALTFIKLKRFDLSLKDIEKVLTINHDRQPYALQAYDNLMLENYEKAISLYNVMINKFDDYYDGYLYRGVAYMRTKQNEKALFDFNYFLKNNPGKPDVYFYISSIYFDLGNYNKAYEFALKAEKSGYKLEPDYLNRLKGKGAKKS